MRFEYLTTFVPVAYEKEERGAWLFKEIRPPRSPIIESLSDNPAYVKSRLDNTGNYWNRVFADGRLLLVLEARS